MISLDNHVSGSATQSTTTYNQSFTVGVSGNFMVAVLNTANLPLLYQPSLTYNGTSMSMYLSEELIPTIGVNSYTKQQVFVLKNPSTGTNNVTVTWPTAPFSTFELDTFSFNGCDGVGNTSYAYSPASTTVTGTIITTANSLILGTAGGGTTQNPLLGAGICGPMLYNKNLAGYCPIAGGVSSNVSNGSNTVIFSGSSSFEPIATRLIELKSIGNEAILI
jgi:hypothetical protein